MGKQWFILSDLPDDSVPYGAEFLYHGILGRDHLNEYESGNLVPLSIMRIVPFVPLVCFPGIKLVISASVKAKFADFQRVKFIPVRFSKLVRLDWRPGDPLPETDGCYADEIIFSGRHDESLVAQVGEYEEVVVSSYLRFLKETENRADRRVKTIKVIERSETTETTLEELSFRQSYFDMVDICTIFSAWVVSEKFIEKVGHLFERPWFRFIPWRLGEEPLDLSLPWRCDDAAGPRVGTE